MVYEKSWLFHLKILEKSWPGNCWYPSPFEAPRPRGCAVTMRWIFVDSWWNEWSEMNDLMNEINEIDDWYLDSGKRWNDLWKLSADGSSCRQWLISVKGTVDMWIWVLNQSFCWFSKQIRKNDFCVLKKPAPALHPKNLQSKSYNKKTPAIYKDSRGDHFCRLIARISPKLPRKGNKKPKIDKTHKKKIATPYICVHQTSNTSSLKNQKKCMTNFGIPNFAYLKKKATQRHLIFAKTRTTGLNETSSRCDGG